MLPNLNAPASTEMDTLNACTRFAAAAPTPIECAAYVQACHFWLAPEAITLRGLCGLNVIVTIADTDIDVLMHKVEVAVPKRWRRAVIADNVAPVGALLMTAARTGCNALACYAIVRRGAALDTAMPQWILDLLVDVSHDASNTAIGDIVHDLGGRRDLALAALSIEDRILHYLGRCGRPDALIQMLANYARNGNIDRVSTMLATGPGVFGDVNEALIAAAEGGHLPVVQALVAAGADDLRGAYVTATNYNHNDAAVFLLEQLGGIPMLGDV